LQLYGWPFGLTPKWRRLVDPYKAAGWSVLVKGWEAVSCGPKRRHLAQKLKLKLKRRRSGEAEGGLGSAQAPPPQAPLV
jgi:hypothetical protein